MKRTTPFVLVADDDPDDRLLLEKALLECREGIEVDFAASGRELADYLYSRADDRLPNLILMDIYMSSRDGFEALKEIKADPRLRRIPIVVLTGSSFDSDADRCYDLGANTVITKPSSFDALVDIIKAVYNYWFMITEG
jgi:CheY-like chemotaxis protein